MIKILEKLFFKKRFILKWIPDNYSNQIYCKGYKINVLQSLSDIDDLVSKDTIFFERNRSFLKNLYNVEWRLFTIAEEGKSELAGYYYALLGNNKPISHDSFIIMPDDALMCRAFIYPKYRNKGLYKTLIKYSHIYLSKEHRKNIYTIVEKSNKASLKANLDSGLENDKTNYLIKIFGINILSIFYQSSRLKLLILGKLFQNRIIFKT